MKRIMLDVPDNTGVVSVTYIYRNDALEMMCGTALITSGNNPDVMRGEKAYVVKTEGRDDEET